MLLCSCLCAVNVSVAGAGTSGEARFAETAVPYGGLIDGRVTDTVYYSRREITDYYEHPYKVPTYLAFNMQNCCAITAGGAIIGNFDRTYEELIPNHTTITIRGQVIYGSQGDAVNAMHQELYQRMGSTSEGTTIAGYKAGMTSYVQSKGRNIEITSICNNYSLDMSAYMSALKANKLLTIFLNGFSIVYEAGIDTYDGYDTIYNTIVKGYHTVAAYGYRNIRYYDASDNLVQEDNYLLVHTGFSTGVLGMIRLNKYTKIEDGYIVNVT